MREIKHLSIHQWLRSAIPDSQQPTSPIGFLFLKLPPPPCAVLLVYIYIYSHIACHFRFQAKTDWKDFWKFFWNTLGIFKLRMQHVIVLFFYKRCGTYRLTAFGHWTKTSIGGVPMCSFEAHWIQYRRWTMNDVRCHLMPFHIAKTLPPATSVSIPVVKLNTCNLSRLQFI